MFIGLMGVDDNGKTMYFPNGKTIGKLPWGLAWKVQRIQHWVAMRTWHSDWRPHKSSKR